MAARLGLTVRLHHGDAIALGPGKADLLAAISQTGSIAAAARTLGLSYRRAWVMVETINTSFAEPLVATSKGGGGGGGGNRSGGARCSGIAGVAALDGTDCFQAADCCKLPINFRVEKRPCRPCRGRLIDLADDRIHPTDKRQPASSIMG